jgi:hypothetical protein
VQAARRALARRRTQRALRLVTFGPSRHAALADDHAIGLVALRTLAQLFPDFFRQHLAARRITPPVLYGAACALHRLVDEELFELREPYELETYRTSDPADLITYPWPESDDVLLNALGEARYDIVQPRPICYGLGVQLIYDAQREIDDYDLLTLALWYVAERTTYALGLPWADLLDRSDWGDHLQSLPTLPVGMSLDVLSIDLDATPLTLTVPGRKQKKPLALDGNLLGYAFGRTGIPLADYDYEEVGYLFNGEMESTWEEAHEIADASRAARDIAERYHALAEAIGQQPALLTPFIRRLVARAKRLVRNGAASVPATPDAAQALVAILADHDNDIAEPNFVQAWLGEGETPDDDDIFAL